MDSKLKQYGISEMTTNPQDFISRKDHARICDSRVSAREADLQVSGGYKPPSLALPSPPAFASSPPIRSCTDLNLTSSVIVLMSCIALIR